jgi:hypothetical protein
MKIKFLILVLTLSYISIATKAQFYIEPSIGLQYPMCSIQSGKFKNFRANTFDELFDWGLGFRMIKSSGNELYMGINNRSVGFSYGVTIPKDLVKNPYSSPKRKHSVSIGMDQLSFSYRGSFHKQIWEEKKKDDTPKKHFQLTLKEGIGISALYVPDIYNLDDSLKLDLVGFYNDTIAYTNKIKVIRNLGASIDAFLTLSLRNNISNKELCSITIYYSKGLVPLMKNDVDYILNSRKGTANLISRGSSLGFSVQVPIKIGRKQREQYPITHNKSSE